MPESPHLTEKNLARLMVRRHLRSWLGSDILSEDLLIAMFIRSMKMNPDNSMVQIAGLVDAEVRTLVDLVLGRDPGSSPSTSTSTDDDMLGLDPG